MYVCVWTFLGIELQPAGTPEFVPPWASPMTSSRHLGSRDTETRGLGVLGFRGFRGLGI